MAVAAAMATISTVQTSPLPAQHNLSSSSFNRLNAPLCVSLRHTQIQPQLRLRRAVVAMATPTPNINDKLSQSIKEAEEVCAAENASGECAAAWDEVEELSAEIAHKKAKNAGESNDPLEKFCKDAPEADECRVYED